MITRLLQRGANPSAKDKNHWTPLHYAVKKKNKGVCLKLLEHGALPDARDKERSMPFTLAYTDKNDDIAAILINFMDNEKCVNHNIEVESIFFYFMQALLFLSKEIHKYMQGVLFVW